MRNNVKLGVRIYSFRNMFPLEESFRKVVEIGAQGFDITASQTVPGYPWPTDEYVEKFKSLYNKYNLKFISYDGNIDLGIRSDRRLNEDEIFGSALNDIEYAHRFGASITRIQWHLPPNVLERLVPYAEAYNIKAAVEIHSPLNPSSPIVEEYIKVFERVQSPYLGLIPDFGAFADKPNKLMVETAISNGTSKEVMDYIIDAIYKKIPIPKVKEEIIRLGAKERDMQVLSDMYHQCFGEPDLEGLKDIMKYSVHFHGKFFGFDENGNDVSIPVQRILPIIRDYGYDGYIASEYEGHGYNDADPVELVKQQRKLYTKILES